MRAILALVALCFVNTAFAETWPADEGQPKINSAPRVQVGDCYDQYACSKGGGKNLGRMTSQQCDASAAFPSMSIGYIAGAEACFDFGR